LIETLLECVAISPGQALLLAGLGFFIGVDKMGLRGGPVIFVPFLATMFGARFTSGLIAPLLLFADILAFLVYRRTWDKRLALRVILWTVAGIGIGVLVGGTIPESLFRIILGVILLVLLVIMSLLEFRKSDLEVPDTPLLTGSIGITAGFASMLGNAAGPIISLYLLAKKLDKRLFLGTSATIFLIVNAVKLPLHIFVWGSVNSRSLGMDLIAVPFILIGALVGKPLVSLIPERAFRYFIMVIALVGAIRMFIV
jgi:uncharacterized membrane protein YfcA